jgi:hypothetical protein
MLAATTRCTSPSGGPRKLPSWATLALGKPGLAGAMVAALAAADTPAAAEGEECGQQQEQQQEQERLQQGVATILQALAAQRLQLAVQEPRWGEERSAGVLALPCTKCPACLAAVWTVYNHVQPCTSLGTPHMPAPPATALSLACTLLHPSAVLCLCIAQHPNLYSSLLRAAAASCCPLAHLCDARRMVHMYTAALCMARVPVVTL